MPLTATFSRVTDAHVETRDGEISLVAETDSGVRFGIRYDTWSGADYARAGLQGARRVDTTAPAEGS